MREGRGYRHAARVVLAFALALGPVLGLTDHGAAPALAAQRVSIRYAAFANPGLVKLCVGEAEEIRVEIDRMTVVNGQPYPSPRITGGYVLAVINDRQIGEFEPSDAGRPVTAQDGDAKFVFRAKKAGQTTIEFHIRETGEESRVGTGFPERGDEINVEVTDCFDAYTSGLANVFITKDMGALDRPFFLEGRLATSQLAGATQLMVFLPNPQNKLTGGYAFVDTAWALVGPGGECTAYVSGRYDVVFYPDDKHPVEGDLLMKGSGVAVCSGTNVPIDYQSGPGFRIGFKPRPTP